MAAAASNRHWATMFEKLDPLAGIPKTSLAYSLALNRMKRKASGVRQEYSQVNWERISAETNARIAAEKAAKAAAAGGSPLVADASTPLAPSPSALSAMGSDPAVTPRGESPAGFSPNAKGGARRTRRGRRRSKRKGTRSRRRVHRTNK